MAITIQSSPATYASMHDDLWFVASSTNVGETSFKFVYDVYVNNADLSNTHYDAQSIDSKLNNFLQYNFLKPNT